MSERMTGELATDAPAPTTPAPPPLIGDPDDRNVFERALGTSLWLVVVLAILLATFSAISPDAFPSTGNLRNISVDASVLLIMAVGFAFVLITAGIDLSIGSVLVFSGVVSAKVMAAQTGQGWDVALLGLVTALAGGAAWGAINGFFITRLEMPPFIVTLGTFGAAQGVALLIADGSDITDVPIKLVDTIGAGNVFGQVPYLSLIAIGVLVLGGLALHKTRFGIYTFAVGSNVEATKRAGVNVRRHLMKVYVLSGTLAGFAGFLALSRFSSTTISGHASDIILVATAVVLGGVSVFGGVGTMLGVLIGVLIPAVLANGLVIAGLQPFWQQVAVGAVLLAAVYVDQTRRRRQS
jgi:ribose transport system permease protein